MKVIVFGYYGYRNVGDEQLLDESIRLLNEYYPTANVVVASGPRPLPFNTFNRWNLLSWIRQLVGAKAVVFGGGSLFQSQSSTLSLLYYLTIVQWARWFGCKVIVLCHGWGPFRSKWHQRLASSVLSKSKVHCSWRDDIAKLSFGDGNHSVFCDLALLQERQGVILSLDTPTPAVAVSFRDEALSTAVSDVCDSYDKRLISLINQPDRVCNQHEWLLEDIWDTPKDFMAELVVTDRYHTAVWASKFGIPWVAISHDPKLMALGAQANQVVIDPKNNDWKKIINRCIQTANSAIPDENLVKWYDSFAASRVNVGEWLYEQLSY